MSFDINDVMEVLEIVKNLKDTEVHIQVGDMKLSISNGDVGDSPRASLGFSNPAATATAPEPRIAEEAVPAPVRAEATKTITEEEIEEGLLPITATVKSVFYRRPSPERPPFVEEGDEVTEDTPPCLLEVMKCFRQVLASVRGRIEKICVESNHFVEKVVHVPSIAFMIT